MGAVFGSGVTKSPVIDNQPKNGKLIVDQENFKEWFEIQLSF